MHKQETIPTKDQTEFVRLQLEVDALLDLPDEHDVMGPTGPEDKYFLMGQEWARLMFTGAFHTVREYLRPSIEPYIDPTLDLAGCISGMSRVLQELTALDPDEFAKAVEGAFRGRRRARQDNADSSVETPPAPAHSMPFHDRELGVRLNEACNAIEALRTSDIADGQSSTETSTPQKVRLLVRAWAVFYVTGLAHTMGGTQGHAMASIADQSISPEECIAGLNRVRERLTRLTQADREAVFAGMDEAHSRYVPEFIFTPA